MPIEAIEPPETHKDAPGASDGPDRTYGPGMKKLHGQLTDLYVNLGAMVVTPLDRLGGALLIAQAPELANTWIDLAETNPAVKRSLLKLVEIGGWGGVIAAHGIIVLPVLANRGMLPDQVASGAAAMTVMQHPEVGPLFTHPRFSNAKQTGPESNGSVG